MYDDATGFLALMKMFDHNPSAVLSERSLTDKQWTVRAPMLALTNPDPALALPSGTTLKPAIYLRNASCQCVHGTIGLQLAVRHDHRQNYRTEPSVPRPVAAFGDSLRYGWSQYTVPISLC